MTELPMRDISLTLHASYAQVYGKLKNWSIRFPDAVDNTLFTDLFLFYLTATKKFLDHRNPSHFFRLVLSINLMKKKLLQANAFSSHQRHLEVRWLGSDLTFTFSFKRVLGCLIGFNVMDRYELFDEENILLTLQKYLPELHLVKESSYFHATQDKNLKIFYLEIEKKNGKPFSLEEQILLKNILDEKFKNSIQKLSPMAYMTHNVEETYKNILILSQEIQSPKDLPQAYITLEQQTGKEIVFHITLVYISPFPNFSLKNYFANCTFASERMLTVRLLNKHPVEAHVFRLHFAREASLLRSDSSLDFYSARHKVAALIKEAIGEFRDYNGGIIITQQELLHCFKEAFPEMAKLDPELMELFFYNLAPLENQVVIAPKTLFTLFSYFLEHRKQKLPKESTYTFTIYQNDHQHFLVVCGDSSLTEAITKVLQEHTFQSQDITYNHIHIAEGMFFNCVVQNDAKNLKCFVQALQQSLEACHQKLKNQQVLRIGLEFLYLFLDPRTGGEVNQTEILRLLFEGLTRFNQKGEVENALAESIEISEDLQRYTFHLRPSLWNDGSPVLAQDFEYAWKKILSPDFKTSFASLFYPIKNAKEAKEGKVGPEAIGIRSLDDRTLSVELKHPTHYFLQLTAHPLYSPVNRLVDQRQPQWPYQSEMNYPCNGPFQLKVNQPQAYVLIRNPYYWDAPQVTLDKVTLTFMNPTRALQAIQKNEVDWIGNPYGVWVGSSYKRGEDIYHPLAENSHFDNFQLEDGISVVSFSHSTILWTVFSTACAPFHSSKLRRAFAYAIDREKFEAHPDFNINRAYSILPHALENYPPIYPEGNIEIARQLLKEGLEELGLRRQDLPPISLSYHEKGIQKHIANNLKRQFEMHLDIKCDLKPLSWNALFHKLQEGDYQIGLVHWMSYLNDPIYSLGAFKSASEGVNFAKWEHPEYQRLLDLSDQEVNSAKRLAYLFQAEQLLSQEMPVVPLFKQPHQALVRKNLNISDLKESNFFNISRTFFKK